MAVGRTEIIAQIVSIYSLNGYTDSAKLKADLEALSDEQLNAELSRLLSGTQNFFTTGTSSSGASNYSNPSIPLFGTQNFSSQGTVPSSNTQNSMTKFSAASVTSSGSLFTPDAFVNPYDGIQLERNYLSTYVPEEKSDKLQDTIDPMTVAQEEYNMAEYAREYLFDSAKSARTSYLSYTSDMGPLDAYWQILKPYANILSDKNVISLPELEEIITKTYSDAQNIYNAKDKLSFEFNFEKYRGVEFDAAKVKDFKAKSEEYMIALAYKNKYDQLEKSIKELKNIYSKEKALDAQKAAGAMIMPSAYPKISSDAKFAQIVDEFCQGNEELKEQFMASVAQNISSKDDFENNFVDILENLQNEAKKAYDEKLNGRTFDEYKTDYETAFSNTFGGENAKELTEAWVMNQQQGSAFLRMTADVAATIILGGSNLVAGSAAKLTTKVGTTAAQYIVKTGMTTFGVVIDGALQTGNAAGSRTGLTPDKSEEIMQSMLNMAPYAFFGAFVSGPMGEMVQKAASSSVSTTMPKILEKAFNKSVKGLGMATEVSADTFFTNLMTDGDMLEALKGNAQGETQARVLNKFMSMLVGGSANKATLKAFQSALKDAGLDGYKVRQTKTGYEMVSPEGNVIPIGAKNSAQEISEQKPVETDTPMPKTDDTVVPEQKPAEKTTKKVIDQAMSRINDDENIFAKREQKTADTPDAETNKPLDEAVRNIDAETEIKTQEEPVKIEAEKETPVVARTKANIDTDAEFKNKTANNIDIAGLSKASLINPQKIVLSGIEYIVTSCSEIEGIGYRIKTKNGTEIIVDALNRPIKIKDFFTTEKLSYESDNALEANLIEKLDIYNKLLSKTTIDNNQIIETDYKKGIVTTTDKNSGNVTTRKLNQFEYPTNISDSSIFYVNLDDEFLNCKSAEELIELKENYASRGYTLPEYYFKKGLNRIIFNDVEQCKTIEQLNQVKNDYISRGIPFSENMYNNQLTKIIKMELFTCETLDDLNVFKDNYLQKGINFSDELYDYQQKVIIDNEIKKCKSIEDLNNFKNLYESKGIVVSDEIYNTQLYGIILSEIKGCKSTESLKELQEKYKAQGLNISDETFDYYSKKLINSDKIDIEIKIKEGNEFSYNRFQNRKINFNDPKYENDIPGVCKEIQTRLEQEMGILSEKQISDIASAVSQKMQVPENFVLEIMSRLTQFGSIKRLNNLSGELDKLGISGFYKESGISTNSSLNYLQKKQQLQLKNEFGNEAFVLDDAAIKYLENLESADLQAFCQKVQDGKIVLVELDGTNLKIGENYYSYTMLDGGQNLSAMTEAVVEQIKSGRTLDAVIQGDIKQRLNNVFKNIVQGDDFAETFVKTISVKEAATPQSIANQIKSNMPNADYIQKVISLVVEKSTGLTESEKVMASSVIAKYYDYMAKVYSPDSFSELLKTKHDAIEQHVLQLGKTMDDVVYIYPESEKSFDLVCLQYAKINDIDPSKILLYNGTERNVNLDGKVLVLLDDIVGSGKSMLTERFHYENCLSNQKDVNILFTPITCADNGKYNIYNKIQDCSRVGSDFLVYDGSQTTKYNDFVGMLSPEEYRVLNKIIGDKGFEDSALCTGFQYMTPDNSSGLGGYFNLINLNNSKSNTANKTNSSVNEIGDILRDYIKNNP